MLRDVWALKALAVKPISILNLDLFVAARSPCLGISAHCFLTSDERQNIRSSAILSQTGDLRDFTKHDKENHKYCSRRGSPIPEICFTSFLLEVEPYQGPSKPERDGSSSYWIDEQRHKQRRVNSVQDAGKGHQVNKGIQQACRKAERCFSEHPAHHKE